MRTAKAVILATCVAATLASCGDTSTEADTGRSQPVTSTGAASATSPGEESGVAAMRERMDVIDAAVAAWRSASSIETASTAAETAANLVVGPNGPRYGDRDGNGVVDGSTTVGLLPGLDGTPAGLATPLAENPCVARDVLGGTWAEPAAEWGKMLAAIDDWRADHNTMPSLASHPMRIVGWATLTLRSESLDEAREYGGHAKLHVDVSVRALDC